jgi:hypothetical protein
MAALITEVLRIGSQAWRYEWSGTEPFTVYVDGNAVLRDSDQTSYIVQLDEAGDEPRQLEVVDSTQTTATMQQVLHTPRIILQFRGRRTNAYYIAQVYNGTTWEGNIVIVEDGRGYYRADIGYWTTFDYQFRVTPYDASGTAGTPLQFSIFHHTNPEPPALSYSYDSGTGKLTVDAI